MSESKIQHYKKWLPEKTKQLKQRNDLFLIACTSCLVVDGFIALFSIFYNFGHYRLHMLIVMFLIALASCLLEVAISRTKKEINRLTNIENQLSGKSKLAS